MKAMIEAGLVDGSHEGVAVFLFCCKRLDKAQIGEFIGDQYAHALALSSI
jgi:hypothetical protein